MLKQLFKITLIITLLMISHYANATELLQFQINGINNAPLKNVQERLDLIQTSYGKSLTLNEIKAIYASAPDNIQEALHPFGYFKSTITPSLIKNKKSWIMKFDIKPGPALTIKNIDIRLIGDGVHDPKITRYIQHFPIKAGQTLNIDIYNKAFNDAMEIANDEGYIKAAFDQKEIRINLNAYEAEITLLFDTGAKYYFGDVTFTPSPFASSFLHRFVRFTNQEAFSSKNLLKFQQDLNNSQYFQQVLVNPDFDQPTLDHHIPIKVDTIAKKSQQLVAGFGYGTLTGPRFTAGVDLRRVTNTGQYFNTQLKLSPVLRGIGAKYIIPGSNPLNDFYTIGINVQEFLPSKGRSISTSLTSSYATKLGDWNHTYSLNYLREKFITNENPWTNKNVLYPSINISRTKSNDPINPSHGTALSFNLKGANQHLLSQVNFVQSEVKAKVIFSPTEPSRLVLRGQLGYTVVQNLDKLPLTLQFVTGGPSSVRGYRINNIGPGRYLKVASAELQHRIIGNWSGAIFYDVGIASNHFNDAPQHSRGLGVIYTSFIGPIKVYFSRADNSIGRPIRVDFNIGPDF